MVSRSEQYDVVIVGGGPGGMAAALWCSELGLSSVLIDERDELGGQLLNVYNRVENYPGVSVRNGVELRDLFVRSLKGRRFELRLGCRAERIDDERNTVELVSGETLFHRALIVATGVRRRKLDIPGEDEFAGRGILSSGLKEAKAVAEKRVLVVGGGGAAIENALILARYARKVIVVHRGTEFKARAEFLRNANLDKTIVLKTQCTVRAFHGRAVLEYAELEEAGNEQVRTEHIDLALVRIGFVPNSEPFSRHLECNPSGYIMTDSHFQTTRPRLYAIGDVAEPVAQTVSAACGAASVACKHIAQMLGKNAKFPKV